MYKDRITYMKWKLKVVAAVILICLIGWFCENARQTYQYNYFEGEYGLVDILDTKVEYLGDTYLNYEAEDGYKLYKIEYLLQNKTFENIEYLYFYYNYECNIIESPKTGEKRLKYDEESTKYLTSQLEVIPAGITGKKIDILEVPEETKEIAVYTKSSGGAEDKETKISLEQ